MNQIRLLYICPGNYKISDGIYQKVSAHLKQWEEEGIESKIITYDVIKPSTFTKILFRLPIPFFRTFAYYLMYTREINKLICKFNPNVIYSRHFLFPFFIKTKKTKLVLEVNGDIEKENQSQSFIKKLIMRKSIKYYDKNCAAVVLVTDSLNHCFKNIKKRITVANSILSSAKSVQINAENRILNFDLINKNKAICFMATKNRAFYAINEIVELVSKLKDKHNLWIIGDIDPEHVKNPSGVCISFWGMQSGPSLKKLLSEAKLGIGTLNVGAVLDGKSSPLKVRTYLENALPVFTEDNDLDFNNSMPFFKGVKFSESKKIGDSFTELEGFIGEIESPDYLKRFADQVKNACLDFREKKRVDFIKDLVNEKS